MPLDPTTAQAQIYDEVGGSITLGSRPEHKPLNVALYWSKNDVFGSMPNLQYARTKLDCVRFLLGQLRYMASSGIGDLNPQLHQRFENLLQIEKDAMQDAEYWQTLYSQQRPNVIVQSTARAPLEGPRFGPDPNSRRLRGDAVFPPLFTE